MGLAQQSRSSGQAHLPKRIKVLSWSGALAAAYAAGMSFRVSVGGQLYVSEILCLTALPFVRIGRLIRHYPDLGTILAGYAILLASLVISDVYNGATSENFLRGWAGVVFAAINLVFLVAIFEKNNNAILAYLLFAAIAAAFVGEVSLDDGVLEEGSNFFKVRIVPVVTPTLILASCWLWRVDWRLAVGLLILGSTAYIIMDARSAGGTLFLAAFALSVSGRGLKFSPARLIPLVLLGLAVAYTGYVIYVDYALGSGGGIGNSATQLARMSNPYNPLELLYFGRTEVFIGVTAALDNPIVGYGSWAPDHTGHYSALISDLKEFRYAYSTPWIPAHSVLVTAWLWAGLGGLIGMLIVFSTALRLSVRAFSTNSNLSPAIYALSIEMLWNFLFSPFGHTRTSIPVVLALLIASQRFAKRMRS